MTSASRNDLILAVNAGSSSLKISLFQLAGDSTDPSLLITSSISNISSPPAKFTFKNVRSAYSNDVDDKVSSITDHASAFKHFLENLQKEASIKPSSIAYVCHRVVHGGDFSDPVIIGAETFHHIERLSDLAPLHNGAALAVIKASLSGVPNSKSVAYFDTAFHRSIPAHIATYAIDQTIAKERGLKKYGFHGLSYSYILRSTSDFLGKPEPSVSLIILHLGSGASACAILNGKCIDTSMGLTPANGLPGATRSGSIDPSLIFHYTNTAGRMSHDPKVATTLHVTEAEKILNTESGWKALTGTTDFGLITQNALEDKVPYKLAFELFSDRIMNYIGSYHLKLGGKVDALVFSGGIGERSVQLRDFIGAKIECLGYAGVDRKKNEKVDETEGTVIDISREKGLMTLVCRTDEQVEMARQCALDNSFWEQKRS